VTGYGVSYGSPDIARVGLGVETSNADVQVALEETNTRLDAVLAALREAGVSDADIQTNYFSIYQDYYGGGPEGRGEPTYRVSSSVNVRVRDTAQVGALIASAVDAGANIVNFVEFNIADRAALESDARELAITDARRAPTRSRRRSAWLSASRCAWSKAPSTASVRELWPGRGRRRERRASRRGRADRPYGDHYHLRGAVARLG